MNKKQLISTYIMVSVACFFQSTAFAKEFTNVSGEFSSNSFTINSQDGEFSKNSFTIKDAQREFSKTSFSIKTNGEFSKNSFSLSKK